MPPHRLLSLDLEADAADPPRAARLGAILAEQEHRGHADARHSAALLDALADLNPDALLGHNLLAHDLPLLRGWAPDHPLLALPVIDTLYLSPLAFPQNPYHALVKGYKLARSAANDPVADAQICLTLLRDCEREFRRQDAAHPGLLAFYCSLFAHASTQLGDQGGLAGILGLWTDADLPDPSDWLRTRLGSLTCQTTLSQIQTRLAALDAQSPAWALGLAFATAWIPVAGGNSVLPHWVTHRIPRAQELITALRATPCQDPTCAWCQETHDPRRQLQRHFGFDDFRPEPAGEDGRSLQAAIVGHAMAGGDALAILPTGGGKSLCFQLPALHRNQVDGALSIVISPLQALMRDQVENLRGRGEGRIMAAALYGLLTPIERAKVLRDVGMGEVSILYIAPEQLRNQSFRKAIQQRRIAAWVFDEAHCLAKWGHDFRPDYLYAARAIGEIARTQKQPIPQILALTATAKQDVSQEILAYFDKEIGKQLRLFDGGVERHNLRFAVEVCDPAEKARRVMQLCRDQLQQSGSVIVYCATRRSAEDCAARLQRAGLLAGHFHGGLSAPDKKRALDAFLKNELRVICATNAFGMGVDKPDVRLVIHLEIPGTLENYLQEAGRAGRDQQAALCVLLFDEADIEAQFRMLKLSEISHADMAQILRGIRVLGRKAQRKEGQAFAITSGELLREDEVDTSFDDGEKDADTKVRMAISWLERASFLQRDLNAPRVFSAKPSLRDMATAQARIQALGLPDFRQQIWTAIFQAVCNCSPDDPLSIDDLARLPAVDAWYQDLPEAERRPQRLSDQCFAELRAMTDAGLLQAGLQLSAFVSPGSRPSPSRRLEDLQAAENALLPLLAESAPDAEEGAWQRLSLRQLAEQLQQAGHKLPLPQLSEMLGALREDGRGFGLEPRVQLRVQDRYRLGLRLQGSWAELRARVAMRQAASRLCLELLLARCPTPQALDHLLDFGLEDLTEALSEAGTAPQNLSGQAEAVLLYLHERGLIILQNGLAIFRSAMNLRLQPEAHGKRYTNEHDAPLRAHYQERTVQVHVMQRYAQLGAENGPAPDGSAPDSSAPAFVQDYFRLPREDFLGRHFPQTQKDLQRPISKAAFAQIVTALDHPGQEAIVTAPATQNQLVLAGPGSGKTRVIVHRCAYLLRVLRVRRQGLLVLCFNRSTVLELRRRLAPLLGGQLQGLQVHTYDSLALRLAGRSLAERELQATADLEKELRSIRQEAIDLLRGKVGEAETVDDNLREQLLRGFTHILVDEYQDIDASQYELISALAGRNLADPDQKLTITAVGDDDQNIYAWRGSDNRFIRRFAEDYGAQRYELLDNYRSSAPILAAANAWLGTLPDRAKQGQIAIDRHRRGLFGGQAPLRRIRVQDPEHQALDLAHRLQASMQQHGPATLDRIAVLARRWDLLQPLRLHAHDLGLPLRWAGGETLRPWILRETGMLLHHLDTPEPLDAQALRAQLDRVRAQCGDSIWTGYLDRIAELYIEDQGGDPTPGREIRQFLLELMKEDQQLAIAERGVFVGTVHQAKGLEFDEVYLCDGGWAPGPHESDADLRRLFYVGMTRARERLAIYSLPGADRSFWKAIAGQKLEDLDPRDAVAEGPPLRSGRLDSLGPRDIDLGWAGRQKPDTGLHRRLSELRIGEPLRIQHTPRDSFLVRVSDGAYVARLSKQGQARVQAEEPEELWVNALMRRTREQVDPEWRERYRVEVWLAVMAEGVWG